MYINYQGAFLNSKLAGSLFKTIEHQHITMVTPKQKQLLPQELLGKEFTLTIDGYANDGQNEGFRVQLPDELKPYYINEAVPHITVSIADGAKAVNTGKLLFKDIDEPFTIQVRIGIFTNGHPIFEGIF